MFWGSVCNSELKLNVFFNLMHLMEHILIQMYRRVFQGSENNFKTMWSVFKQVQNIWDEFFKV